MRDDMDQLMARLAARSPERSLDGFEQAVLRGVAKQRDDIRATNALTPVRVASIAMALAITSSQRNNATPQLATVAESGVPGYDASIWFGIVAPAGTPSAIVDRLSGEIAQIVRSPAMRFQSCALSSSSM